MSTWRALLLLLRVVMRKEEEEEKTPVWGVQTARHLSHVPKAEKSVQFVAACLLRASV